MMRVAQSRRFLLWGLFLATLVMAVSNQATAQTEEEFIETLQSIDWVSEPGPVTIGDNARLELPEGYIFTGREGTQTIMELFENPLTGIEQAFVSDSSLAWYVIFEFDEMGYVKDDEKDDLDADALLTSLREGQEEGNKERLKRGWGTLTILGWYVPPRYNPQTHNLEWATRLVDDYDQEHLNYNTRILGRHGIMVVTLVTDVYSIDSVMSRYQSIIGTFDYTTGNKYAEYREGDKIAEYGLTALIAGGAGAIAAKTGFFKWIWKILVAAFVGAAGFFKKIFGKKKKPEVLG